VRQWPAQRKLELDFLLRPATMTLRQHLRYRAFYKTGKPARRRQCLCGVGADRYGVGVHERWLQRPRTAQTADGIVITIGDDVVAPRWSPRRRKPENINE
jgi:hypothetical protein